MSKNMETKAVGVHKTDARAAQKENPRDVQNTQVFSKAQISACESISYLKPERESSERVSGNNV